MEREELQRIIEAILFAAGERVEISRLAQTLEVDPKDITEATDALADKLAYDRRGIRILKLEQGYQMVSSGELHHKDPGNPEAAQAFCLSAGDVDDHCLLPARNQGNGRADSRCGQLLFRGGAAEQEAD